MHNWRKKYEICFQEHVCVRARAHTHTHTHTPTIIIIIIILSLISVESEHAIGTAELNTIAKYNS
jgi:hypothetical protein